MRWPEAATGWQEEREAWQDGLREEARAILAARRFRDFARTAWGLLPGEAAPVWSWHLDLLCDAAERLWTGEVAGDYPGMVVNIPPGFGKSIVLSALFPAWLFLQDPSLRLLTLSADPEIVLRDADRQLALMATDWYSGVRHHVALLGESGVLPPRRSPWRWTLRADRASLSNFKTSAGGGRMSRAYGANSTGHRANFIIIDDPMAAADAFVGSDDAIEQRHKNIVNLFSGAIESRLTTRLSGHSHGILLVTQRLGEIDLSAHLIGIGAEHVSLPLEFDSMEPTNYRHDPRRRLSTDELRVDGGMLFPALKDRAAAIKLRQGASAHSFEWQYNQRGSGKRGGIYTGGWKEYDVTPVVAALQGIEAGGVVVASVDSASSKEVSAADTAVTLWLVKGAERWLIWLFMCHEDFVGIMKMLRSINEEWPFIGAWLVENRSTGSSIIPTMRAEGFSGVIPYEPKISKESRAQLCAPLLAADGRIPRLEHAPWIELWKEAHLRFPNTRRKDIPDTTAQLILQFATQQQRGGAPAAGPRQNIARFKALSR